MGCRVTIENVQNMRPQPQSEKHHRGEQKDFADDSLVLSMTCREQRRYRAHTKSITRDTGASGMAGGGGGGGQLILTRTLQVVCYTWRGFWPEHEYHRILVQLQIYHCLHPSRLVNPQQLQIEAY